MHKKYLKFAVVVEYRVSAAKIYLYHSTKIAKARLLRVEWQTDSSVQKQWFMANLKVIHQRVMTTVLVQLNLYYNSVRMPP